MRPSDNGNSIESLLTALGDPRGHRLWVQAVSIHPLIFALAKRFDRVILELKGTDRMLRDDTPLPTNVECVSSLNSDFAIDGGVFDAALLMGALSAVPKPVMLLADCLLRLRDRGRLMVVEYASHARTEAQQNSVAVEQFLRNGQSSIAADFTDWPTLDTLRSQLEQSRLRHLRALEVAGSWISRFGHTEGASAKAIAQRVREYVLDNPQDAPGDSSIQSARLQRIEARFRISRLAPLDLLVLHGVYKSHGNSQTSVAESSSTDSLSDSESSDISSLSLAELLSLVMTGGESASRMSRLTSRILQEYGARAVASEHDPQRLSAALEIPLARAAQIAATFEIGRRFYESSDPHRVLLRGPEDIASHAAEMASLRCEQFRVLCIDSDYRLIHEEIASTGSEASTHVHPRDVLRPALLRGATALAFIHNHPSGDPSPSDRDIEATRALCRAAEIVAIPILDHVIIADSGWFSMRKNDLLP